MTGLPPSFDQWVLLYLTIILYRSSIDKTPLQLSGLNDKIKILKRQHLKPLASKRKNIDGIEFISKYPLRGYFQGVIAYTNAWVQA